MRHNLGHSNKSAFVQRPQFSEFFSPCGFCLKIILVGKYFLLHNYLSGQSSRKFNAAWKKENQIEQPCKSIGRLLHSYAVIEQNNAA